VRFVIDDLLGGRRDRTASQNAWRDALPRRSRNAGSRTRYRTKKERVLALAYPSRLPDLALFGERRAADMSALLDGRLVS
jgi:hypothetical protein